MGGCCCKGEPDGPSDYPALHSGPAAHPHYAAVPHYDGWHAASQAATSQNTVATMTTTRTMFNSNYLDVYENTDRKPHKVPKARRRIQQALNTAVGEAYGRRFLEICREHNATTVQAVIRMWTDGSDHAVYVSPTIPCDGVTSK